MKYYTPEEPVPAAAITIVGKDSVQPILFTTQTGYGRCEDGGIGSLNWLISQVKVTLVRDWNTSIANITLTVPIPNTDGCIPLLPDVSSIRGGNYPYLTYEDEIRIYAGWIPSYDTPITSDLLDEIPIDLYPSGETPNLDHNFISNPNKPLAPIFWGFIDTINIIADKGIQCIIQCRDRARVFSDTTIISVPALQGTLTGKDGGLADGARDKILLQVAKAATGQLLATKPDDTPIWRKILGPDDSPDVNHFSAFKTLSSNELKRTLPLEDPPLWVRSSMFRPMHPGASPRFHIWTQKPPYKKANGSAVFQILDSPPLRIMRFLASVEERPVDFFASHVNGDFLFAPDVLDTSGFKDPKRMYRTYFYKTYPKDLAEHPPSPNQMIISMRVSSSSLATYNRYVVINGESHGKSSDFLDSLQLAADVQNWSLQGRTITPPSRNHIIYDSSLSAYANPEGAALLVALSQGRLYSRELSQLTMTVLGDPTWYPNEAVRVYNSILHDHMTLMNPGTNQSVKEHESQQAEWELLTEAESKDRFKNEGKRLKDFGNPLVKSEVDKLSKGKLPTGGAILPTYKVRSIQHVIIPTGKTAGYTTKLEMISDY